MRASIRAAAAAAVALVVCALPVTAQSTRPTVAVLEFRGRNDRTLVGRKPGHRRGDLGPARGRAGHRGSYRIIERKRLDAILAEQNFSQSERADPSAKTLAQVGKVLGVKYLIVGSITKFGTEKSNKSFSGGGFGNKFGVGEVGTAKGKANVAIAARMIDTTTGEILAVAKGDGTSKRSGLLLGGGAGGFGGAGVGRIEFGSSEFRDTILGEATEMAVKQTANKLVAAKTRLQ